MRVIAGSAKGRRLQTIAGGRVRPMTDQIREALFSTLGPRIAGARFLDLYAGSGSAGIEAASRGAAHVTFVEKDSEAVQAIRANLEVTGFAALAKVVAGSAERFVSSPPGEPYTIVMIDPPFSLGLPSGVLESLATWEFLAAGAVVVVRVASRILPAEVPARFRTDAQRRYGDSTLLYMSLATAEGSAK